MVRLPWLWAIRDRSTSGIMRIGRVVEFDSSGKLLAAWGNTGSYKDQLSEAGGLALGKDGSVYVGDGFDGLVAVYKPHQ